MTTLYITRSQWGARAPKGSRNSINASPLGVAVHWNGPGCAASIRTHDKCAGFVRGIQGFHMGTRGWSDIAYTMFACPHGHLFEGRGKGVGTAANGTDYGNANYYAIYAMWGQGDGDVPEPMLDAIADGVALCRSWGAGRSVTTHNRLFSTECPGEELTDYVDAGRFSGGSSSIPRPSKSKPSKVFAPAWVPTGAMSVKQIQKAVGVTADGLYGAGTKAAVAKYQRKLGVAADGLWGPSTEAAHKRGAGATLATDGLMGPATIRELQKALGVKVDGLSGPATNRALQRRLGVAQDGIVGKRTIKALQRAVGVAQDGIWGKATTRSLQRSLNAGRF